MLRVGLTGGIGSGKSTIAMIFTALGIPVLQADLVAKNIMDEDPAVREAISRHFGSELYVNKELDRRLLAAKVFTDNNNLTILNSIVHPATIRYANEWMQRQTAPYAIKEAALFFESGSAANIDIILGIDAPQALRVLRVMQRDKVDRAQVLDRINKQIPASLKMKLCDGVIDNSEQQLVIPQVLGWHQKLLQLAKTQHLKPHTL